MIFLPFSYRYFSLFVTISAPIFTFLFSKLKNIQKQFSVFVVCDHKGQSFS